MFSWQTLCLRNVANLDGKREGRERRTDGGRERKTNLCYHFGIVNIFFFIQKIISTNIEISWKPAHPCSTFYNLSLFTIIYRQPQLLFSVKSLRLVDSVCELCKKQERLLKSSHSYETVKPKYLCGDVSLVFMISDRCQGLVHVHPDNNVPMLWMPDALLGNDASTVECVAHTLMKGDQWEAWLTSITLKC